MFTNECFISPFFCFTPFPSLSSIQPFLWNIPTLWSMIPISNIAWTIYSQPHNKKPETLYTWKTLEIPHFWLYISDCLFYEIPTENTHHDQSLQQSAGKKSPAPRRKASLSSTETSSEYTDSETDSETSTSASETEDARTPLPPARKAQGAVKLGTTSLDTGRIRTTSFNPMPICCFLDVSSICICVHYSITVCLYLFYINLIGIKSWLSSESNPLNFHKPVTSV